MYYSSKTIYNATHLLTVFGSFFFSHALSDSARVYCARVYVRSVVNPPARIGNEVNKKWQRGGQESKTEGANERYIGEGDGEGAGGKDVCECMGVMERKNCKSATEGKRLWGCWWSAVVHCKSPSTAFNYDVIANTDDGYFLRYTLYITRGPTTSLPRQNQEP